MTRFFVTGPGVEEKVCPSGEAGLSAALGFSQAPGRRADGEASYYVRDEAGNCYGRVDRLADGGALVYGPERLGYRAVAAERGPAAAQASGRRTPARTTTSTTNQEDSVMATQKTPPRRSSERSAPGPREAQQREQRETKASAAPAKDAAPVEAKQQPEPPKDAAKADAKPPAAAKADAKPAAAAKPEKAAGADLYKGVQAALREAKVGTVKPHSGGLYARLMDGKRTVGYIVTRKAGVRAYPNCLASAMPKGLSFTKVELGAHHYGRGEVIIDVASEGDFKDVVAAMQAAKANPIPRAKEAAKS